MAGQQTRSDKRAATAQRILDAARAEFGAHGENGATIRGIARRADVDPSLVLQHYGSKQALFSLAVQPADDIPPQYVPEHLAEVLAMRLRELPPETRALMRSMLTSPAAATVMREYLDERANNLASSMTGDDANARAAVTVASILGITIARHFLELPGLSGMTEEQVSAIAARWSAFLDATG